jgi:endonuclease G
VGTSSNLNTLTSGQPVYSQSALTIGSGSFNAAVGALEENTTYYYVAFMEVLVNGTYQEVYGTVKSFKTLSASTSVTLNKDWMELPESPGALNGKYLVTMRGTLNGKDVRNYTILYDPSRFASLWTAYVYCSAFNGSGTGDGWTVNKQIPASQQTSVKYAYPSVNGVTYDRGHQIPNADRNAENSLQAQTYYWTNSTPQHASFNQGIWNNLEKQVRSLVSSSDSVYVITGPVYQTVGGSETVKTFVNSTNDSKTVHIPNYYFKVLLKVRRSGGQITAASAIGFWFTHEAHTDEKWQDYTVTVDEIEQKTGFNFFANLPPSVEATAEQNSNWNMFKNF